MVRVSRGLKFTTVEYMPRWMAPMLSQSLYEIYEIYSKHGFTVDMFLMDWEFECLQETMLGTSDLNKTAADKHVPDIDRQIWLLNERAHAIRSRLPFQKLPGRITIELIVFVVLWINSFPPESEVSQTYSPRKIVTGRTPDYQKHYKVKFGEYAECQEDKNP